MTCMTFDWKWNQKRICNKNCRQIERNRPRTTWKWLAIRIAYVFHDLKLQRKIESSTKGKTSHMRLHKIKSRLLNPQRLAVNWQSWFVIADAATSIWPAENCDCFSLLFTCKNGQSFTFWRTNLSLLISSRAVFLIVSFHNAFFSCSEIILSFASVFLSFIQSRKSTIESIDRIHGK